MRPKTRFLLTAVALTIAWFVNSAITLGLLLLTLGFTYVRKTKFLSSSTPKLAPLINLSGDRVMAGFTKQKHSSVVEATSVEDWHALEIPTFLRRGVTPIGFRQSRLTESLGQRMQPPEDVIKFLSI